MDEIPPQLQWLAHLAEPWRPKDSATDMRGVADLFYDHAGALAGLHSNLQQARQNVQDVFTGATAHAVDRQLFDGAHSLDDLIHAARAHGDSISNYATEIENTNNQINQTLAVTHNSIIEAVLDSLQNGPVSLGRIPPIKQLAEHTIRKLASDAVGRIDATLANNLGGASARLPIDGTVAAGILGGQLAQGRIGDVLHSALSTGALGTGALTALQTSLHQTPAPLTPGIQLAAQHTAGDGSPANGRVPLHMLREPTIPFGTAGIMPEVNVSVDGGKREAVGFDTGSAGLNLPITDIPLRDFAHFTGFGYTGYGNSDAQTLQLLAKFEAPIEIGDPGHSVTTAPTEISAPIVSVDIGTGAGGKHPYIDPYFNFPPFDNGHHVDPVGILGVGPSATGPGHTVLDALPPPYRDGVLIDAPEGYAQFGPDPLSGGYRVDGSPMTTVDVQVNNGPIHHNVPMAFDSGGQYGVIQKSFLPNTEVLHAGNGRSLEVAPAGTEVTVYDHGHKLYSFTTTGSERMQVVSGDEPALTGMPPFLEGRVYVGNDQSNSRGMPPTFLPGIGSTTLH